MINNNFPQEEKTVFVLISPFGQTARAQSECFLAETG